LDKWFKGIAPEQRKELVTRKVLDLIPQFEEISWSGLLEKAEAQGIGRATLSRHLKRLVKAGIVERRVDTSSYPPRVFYKRCSPDKPKLYMPYEFARELFPRPTRKSRINEVENWILAQTKLFLARVILELTPPPFLFRGASEQEIRENLEEVFKTRDEVLLNHLLELQQAFAGLTLFDAEKAARITHVMILEYRKMFESALKLYNLTPEKIMKIKNEP